MENAKGKFAVTTETHCQANVSITSICLFDLRHYKKKWLMYSEAGVLNKMNFVRLRLC